MVKPARTLIAGTLTAIPLLALLCGVATSQVVNDQDQSGDIFASGTLNVVTSSGDTTQVTTATGNSLTGSVATGSLDVQNTQNLSGQVGAQTTVNVTLDSGPNTTVNNAATGNTADVGISGGGSITGTSMQIVTGASAVTATTDLQGPTATTGAAAVSNQAIANSVGFGATDANVDYATGQTNAADVRADAAAVLQYLPGDTNSFSSGAVANNVTATAADFANQSYSVTQDSGGGLVQATFFTSFGNSQGTITNATASANNANITNVGGDLNVITNQDNGAYVRAQAEETSYSFGGATAQAYGVGNSALAGNYGPNVTVDNTQVNSGGGVDAIASFSGTDGYDAYASSTAMGNAVTGYACSLCQPSMTATNRQTNSADIGSTTSVTVDGSGRRTVGSSTAVGNSASFYVTQPTN